MKRITINIDDNLFKNLNENSERMNVSLSKYVNILIEKSIKNDTYLDGFYFKNSDNFIKKAHLKNLMKWSLETTFLVRHLVENNPAESDENRKKYMQLATEKADSVTNDMLNSDD